MLKTMLCAAALLAAAAVPWPAGAETAEPAGARIAVAQASKKTTAKVADEEAAAEKAAAEAAAAEAAAAQAAAVAAATQALEAKAASIIAAAERAVADAAGAADAAKAAATASESAATAAKEAAAPKPEAEAPAPEPAIDSGATAWMIVATALVLFMTIPGLSLFYAGLVRSKNVLSVLMQCFAITALCTVLWVVAGYSLAFANMPSQAAGVLGLHSFVGGLDKAFFAGVTPSSISGMIPENVFAMFQLTFFIITPALICGAYAERMKFSAMMLFTAFWAILVYAPVCHMAWSGGGALFADWGVLDFAGGTVVHINAGIAALVSCIVLGRRDGYPNKPMPPHNLTMSVTGAGMLWVGWFGFNAGSQLAADGIAGNAMLVTQVATAAATLVWMAIEWIKHGKPSVLGAVTGAVAGLVAITPASGKAGVAGALAIGAISALVCFYSATVLKKKLGYDDSLDAFGVHCVGGIVGAFLTGVFANPALGGLGFGATPAGELDAVGQIVAQCKSIVVTLVYSGVLSFVILKAIDAVIGLRVTKDEETQGLDLTQHGEEGYLLH